MTAQTASRPEMTMHVISLARFAILCTLGLAAALLLGDFLGRGWSNGALRFLSEQVVITLVCVIAAEVVAAIAAVTCMALWKQ